MNEQEKERETNNTDMKNERKNQRNNETKGRTNDRIFIKYDRHYVLNKSIKYFSMFDT